LRLTWQAEEIRMESSPDSKQWSTVLVLDNCPKSSKVKVGVLAEATAEGTFKAQFDRFKLLVDRTTR
jgi:regulation of enolase protein 1 (concanavalin A-like superfamily)